MNEKTYQSRKGNTVRIYRITNPRRISEDNQLNGNLKTSRNAIDGYTQHSNETIDDRCEI